jgi:hypothetical protein
MDPIEVYERCILGKPYSKELKIYSKRYLQKVIEGLVELEEYEKCIELTNFIELRFSHENDYYGLNFNSVLLD